MAQIVHIGSSYEDEVRLVAGLCDAQRSTQYELYRYCADYFWANYRALFFVVEKDANEILQDAFIKLWEHIETRRIYVKDQQLMGKDHAPFKGSIRTYFMSIAHYKYQEWTRSHIPLVDPEAAQRKEARHNGDSQEEWVASLYGDEEHGMYDIIADLVATMSARCSEILMKFYYEGKELDRILDEIPSIVSKDALKTKKHKCMETLRKSAQEMYHRYLNE